MPQIVVTEGAIREVIKAALENRDFGTLPKSDSSAVSVNPVVDPLEHVTDPSNPNYMPQNKVEFGVAVGGMVKDVQADNLPDLYRAVKAAVDELEPDAVDRKANKMKSTSKKPTDKKVEETVRLAVRKLVAEAFKGKDVADIADIDDEEDEEVAPPEDEAGATFEDIASELGISVSGAKKLVDQTIAKSQWLAKMGEESPEDLEILVLTATKDYINYLKRSGELTAADVKLLGEHPAILQSLDGFKSHLHKYIRKARKAEGQVSDESEQD